MVPTGTWTFTNRISGQAKEWMIDDWYHKLHWAYRRLGEYWLRRLWYIQKLKTKEAIASDGSKQALLLDIVVWKDTSENKYSTRIQIKIHSNRQYLNDNFLFNHHLPPFIYLCCSQTVCRVKGLESAHDFIWYIRWITVLVTAPPLSNLWVVTCKTNSNAPSLLLLTSSARRA